MGLFLFGTPPESVRVEDRLLAHVKIVMLTKLRRHEAFAFSYNFDQTAGGGRATIWISPSVLIQFRFDGGRPPAINKLWLEALMMTANETDGLRLVPEPDATWDPQAPSGTIPVQK